MKRKVRRADEHDLVSGWRKLLCYMQRPGVTAGIKRRLNRRDRHDTRRRIAKDGEV